MFSAAEVSILEVLARLEPKPLPSGEAMRFTIRYFRDNRLLGEHPWEGLHRNAKHIAEDGLAIYGADTAIIFDADGYQTAKVTRHS